MIDDELRQQLVVLQAEHRDLDAMIATIEGKRDVAGNELVIARCKKRKLRLKDQITMIERQLVPDELA